MREKTDKNSIENNTEQQQNKSNFFNIIIGVSSLIIAILGATFAYFSATASSKENDISVKSAYVSISYDGGTEIKASNLIPTTEKIALAMYKKEAPKDEEGNYHTEDDGYAFKDEDDYKNDTTRKCIDAKGREVCYIYQFSLESDGEENGETEFLGAIKIDTNQFTNLSYVLYEVEYETTQDEEGEDTELLDVFGHKVVKKYTPVSEFNETDYRDDPEMENPKYAIFEKPIRNTIGGNFVSTTHPYACLFGFSDSYNTEEVDSLTRCRSVKIENKKKHNYQAVVWLMETDDIQEEQDLVFNGTIKLEVIGRDGSDAEGHITGETTDESTGG